MDKKTYTLVILSTLFGLIGGTISTSLINQPVFATRTIKVIEAEEFSLVDKKGKHIGGMKSFDDGTSLIYLQGDGKDKSGIKIKVSNGSSSLNIVNEDGKMVSKLNFDSKTKSSGLSFFTNKGFDTKNPTLPEVLVDNSTSHSGLSIFVENKPSLVLGTDNKKDNPSLLLLNKNRKNLSLFAK